MCGRGRLPTLCLLMMAGSLGASAADGSGRNLPGSLDPAAVEFFESKVRPVLVEHCYSCHSAGAEKLKGDLRLDTKEGWSRGGLSRHSAVVPGKPVESPLIRAVRHTDPELAMPPKQKLSLEQIEALEAWVRMGAPDPRTGGELLPDPKQQALGHWAFQPVREPSLPSVKNSGWVRNPIDRFVLATMEQHGLSPAPRADRRTLIRRASIVLTGLPPTRAEVEAFEADDTDEALARVVDRLLASPRYGERWGRHWMDIARYADTKGYVFEEERRYAYAYTYRDYVIRAFNDDTPYDRFLVEQLAGDQVVEGDDRSALAAMGFLTLGRRFLNNAHDIIDDRIDVLTRGTMALTVACARCHDHKYDPIPTEDYYSLYGVFASSHEPDEKPLLGVIPDAVRHEAFQKEQRRRTEERDAFVAKKETEYRRRLRDSVGDYLMAAHDASKLEGRGKREELARSRKLSPVVVERWIEALSGWRRDPNPLFQGWIVLSELPADASAEVWTQRLGEMGADSNGRFNPAVVAAVRGAAPTTLREFADRMNAVFKAGDDPQVRAFLEDGSTPLAVSKPELYRLFDVPDAQKRRALQRAVEELQATHPGAPPRGMVLADNGTPSEPVVFKRGNPGSPGAKVPRQFLGFLAGPERKPFTQGSGRLELAKAIASPSNPLTARVAVNRVWQQHFGAGLVRTPADFGLRAEPPTHPELLDWLASRFVADGWSFKRLHRLILLSAAWQQSALAEPEVVERDPENRYLARQNRRRLDFESMRDTLLDSAGRLDLAMGGHGVDITTRDYASRRTVYGFVERQNLPGVFRTFDFASPDTSSAQRFQTTVPQQALYLMNSPFALDQARRVAARRDILDAPTPGERVDRLYETILQRRPTTEERELAERFLASANGTASTSDDLSPLERYSQVLLVSNEAVFVD